MNRKKLAFLLPILPIAAIGTLSILADSADKTDYSPKGSEMYNSQNTSIRQVECVPTTQPLIEQERD